MAFQKTSLTLQRGCFYSEFVFSSAFYFTIYELKQNCKRKNKEIKKERKKENRGEREKKLLVKTNYKI
jgi:hypothetical protein